MIQKKVLLSLWKQIQGKSKEWLAFKKIRTQIHSSNTIDFNVPVEPGSLIKTFDMMSLLEDKKADTSSVYNAKGGEISLYGQKIVDGHLGFKNYCIPSFGVSYNYLRNEI